MPRTATPAPKIWRNFIENPPSSTAARRFQSLTIKSIRRGYGSPSVKFTRPRHASPAEWPAFITGIDDGDDPTTTKKCSFGGFAKYSGLTYPSGGVGPFGSGGSFECACNRCLHCPHARHDSLWMSLFCGKNGELKFAGIGMNAATAFGCGVVRHQVRVESEILPPRCVPTPSSFSIPRLGNSN